jgi:Arc/MetJ-type ribon-helix-helix transcriptional regulator
MKTKISVSIDKETIQKMEEQVSKGIFRNKSHAVEFALNKLGESQ